MIGDKIVIRPHHTKAAEGAYVKVKKKINEKHGERLAITVAGESGSGKSEIAYELARLLHEKDSLKVIILAQDDYFILPPKSNAEARKKDIAHVGMHEVNLPLLDDNIAEIKRAGGVDFIGDTLGTGTKKKLIKPLVDFDRDEIGSEEIDTAGANVVIAEGTYTTALRNADIRIFIDRVYQDTLEHRRERGRDELDEYTEKILEIEHGIISTHKENADIVVKKDYSVDD
ncbi:MAG: hypothetical protein ABIH89_03365 [Elusimicrobiota bacterium]